MTFVIGVIGQSSVSSAYEEEVWDKVSSELNKLDNRHADVMVLGGLTDTPSAHRAAYMIARRKGWKVGGIACRKADKHKWFPMNQDGDVLKIVGNHWGDEIPELINRVDVLIRVGGNKQMIEYAQMARDRGIEVSEVDLDFRKG